MPQLISLLMALLFSAATLAQPSPARQVELLAPQLIAFAGSAANFESLVNGLAQGVPVTLTAVGADGLVQVVTFDPSTTLSPADVARTLESARQSLISQGIAAPTPQQLAISLVGGALPTAMGSTPVSGVLDGDAQATPVQVRNVVTTPPATVAASSARVTAADLQALRTGLAQNTPVTLPAAGGDVTFTAPGRPLSAFEINQALQLASLLLAQQGIFDPTPEQLRAALLGGTLGTAAAGVPVRGVLQGQVRNTSDSRLFGTSDSQVVGTSNTPPGVNSPAAGAFTGAPASTGASAPAPAAGPPAASVATTPRFRATTRR